MSGHPDKIAEHYRETRRCTGWLGVARLIASCLNDARRHTALIDVSSYRPGPKSRRSGAGRSAASAAASASMFARIGKSSRQARA